MKKEEILSLIKEAEEQFRIFERPSAAVSRKLLGIVKSNINSEDLKLDLYKYYMVELYNGVGIYSK